VMGTQATLVALPFQIYTQTGSAFLTGLLGLVELGPLVVMTLLGGALADRHDRRRLLLLDQIALVATASLLAVGAFAGSPPIGVLYVLGGLLGGFGAVQNVIRSAIVPNVVAPELLRSAIALNFGLFQLTYVVGPGVGGLVIGAFGVGAAYTANAVSCLAMVAAALAMSPQAPRGGSAEPVHVLRSIGEGLGFVRRSQALMGSFACDLVAMTFGMPRALFPVLAVSVYGAGAEGAGLLYASVAAGATVTALTTGWLAHARRLGVLVVCAVGDQPERHARPRARAHVVGVLARGRQRPAPRRRRGRRGGGAGRRPVLRRVGRRGVRRGDRDRRARVPGAHPLRRRALRRPARARARARARRRRLSGGFAIAAAGNVRRGWETPSRITCACWSPTSARSTSSRSPRR
jgi:MFS family permease